MRGSSPTRCRYCDGASTCQGRNREASRNFCCKIQRPRNPIGISAVKRIFLALCLVGTALLTACSTTHSSYAQNGEGKAEVVAASEEEILAASHEAITRTFQSAFVYRLPPPALGFHWYVIPVMDRTDFHFHLIRQVGEGPDHTKISGWGYDIRTNGTQGLVQARYVTPLIAQLKATFAERNLKTFTLTNVSYPSKSD